MIKQKGAVLLAVLVVSMVLTLLLSAAHTAMSQRLELAQQMNDLTLDKAAAYAQLQSLSYLAATQRITRAGISTGTDPQGLQREDGIWLNFISGDEYRVDGYEYEHEFKERKVSFKLQAENGLIPINVSGSYWLKWYLSRLGYSYIDVISLMDKLADYADADEFARPGGAELLAYRKLDLAPPPNYLLQQSIELHNVIDWPEALAQNSELTRFLSVKRSNDLNFNAIPIELWQSLWPGSWQQVQQRRKNQQWFISLDEIKMLVPELANIPEPYYTVLPQKRFLVTVTAGQVRLTRRLVIGDKLLPPLKQYLVEQGY